MAQPPIVRADGCWIAAVDEGKSDGGAAAARLATCAGAAGGSTEAEVTTGAVTASAAVAAAGEAGTGAGWSGAGVGGDGARADEAELATDRSEGIASECLVRVSLITFASICQVQESGVRCRRARP